MLVITGKFTGWKMGDLILGVVTKPIPGPFKIRIVKPEEKRHWVAECMNCGKWAPIKAIEKSTNVKDVQSAIAAMFVKQSKEWEECLTKTA